MIYTLTTDTPLLPNLTIRLKTNSGYSLEKHPVIEADLSKLVKLWSNSPFFLEPYEDWQEQSQSLRIQAFRSDVRFLPVISIEERNGLELVNVCDGRHSIRIFEYANLKIIPVQVDIAYIEKAVQLLTPSP